jgi:hypothetical protein
MHAELVAGFRRRIEAIPVPTGATAPVTWFLDIDGVVNVIGPPPKGGWPKYERTGVSAFDGLMWPIVYSADMIALLNRLSARGVVSFRWLTTWEHDAPKRFAPAVGLRVGEWVAAEDTGNSNTWWKLEAIVEHRVDSTQLFIWTDDDIKHFHVARQIVDHVHPPEALILCPDERKGITPEDFDTILTAIEEALA